VNNGTIFLTGIGIGIGVMAVLMMMKAKKISDIHWGAVIVMGGLLGGIVSLPIALTIDPPKGSKGGYCIQTRLDPLC
jgi:hypothetical protein